MKKDQLIGYIIGIQALALPGSIGAVVVEYFKISKGRSSFRNFETPEDIFLYGFYWWVGLTIFGILVSLRMKEKDRPKNSEQ